MPRVGLLIAVGRSLYERGLTNSTAGNLSQRTENGFIITATNTSLGALTPDDLVRGDAPNASKEWPFHAAIYARRPDVHAIMHLHSPAATALSCLVRPTDRGNSLPVVTPYAILRVGRVPCVEYLKPGSEELARRIGEVCAPEVNAILLQNHGMIALGRSLAHALAVTEELEACAQIWVQTGGRARTLTEAEVEELGFPPGLQRVELL
jgi:3-dehydro-4-phosphotetronate decarboxylase